MGVYVWSFRFYNAVGIDRIPVESKEKKFIRRIVFY